MNELGNIAFGAIPEPNPERSFLHNEDPEGLHDLAFYIDDIFPAHATWQEHYLFLRDHLLPRLLWARLPLSFGKIKIGLKKMLALGEVHEAGGKISIKPERIRLIMEWPIPSTPTDIRSFLGTVITTRAGVKGFAEIARPMQRLTGKVDWRWEEAEQLSFDLLRNLCARAVMRYGWNPALPVEVFADASKFAAGCHISQRQNGVNRPILYDSFAFTTTEQRYDTYKRELRAICKFTSKHQHMLRGSITSIIHTDHKPLVTFLNSDTDDDTYARWAIKLRLLNVRLQHIEGKRNQAADGLSRTLFNGPCTGTRFTSELCNEVLRREKTDPEWFSRQGPDGYKAWVDERREKEKRSEEVNHVVTGWSPMDQNSTQEQTQFSCNLNRSSRGEPLKEAQRDSMIRVKKEWYQELEDYYRHQKIPQRWTPSQQATFKRKAAHYRWNGEKLVHKVDEKWVTCIGPEDVAKLLQQTHDENGHFSSKIILERIRSRAFWPGMAQDVRSYVQGCIECARHAIAGPTQPLQPVLMMRPGSLFGFDHIGPLRKTYKGNLYILNGVDYMSRLMLPKAVPDLRASTTVKALEEIFSTFPYPMAIYTDPGTTFDSKACKDWAKKRNIHFTIAPTGAKRAVGMIERANGILQNSLKSTLERDILANGLKAKK